MSNWWYATSVDVEQGSNLIRVNAGDDTRYFERGSCWLKIAGHDAVETDGLITDGSDTFIRLVKDWSGETDTGRRAFAFRTVPDFQGVADKLALNIQASERVVSDVIGKMGTLLTSTDESVVIETPEGDVEVVPYGYLKNQIESEWGDIKQDVSVTQARLDAMEKLKRNAVVYLDFANNEGKEADDFTVVRDDATNLIDCTAPDGVSVQTADGRIVFAPANTAALGWNDGRAVGLVSAPASTNLFTYSENLSSSGTSWGNTRLSVEVTSLDAPVFDVNGNAAKWCRLTEDSESSTHTITQSVTSVSGEPLSSQVVAKAEERSQIRIALPNNAFGGSFTAATFDVETGEVLSTTPAATQARIIRLRDGAFRCEAWRTATNSVTASAEIRLAVDGSNTYQGDGSSGLLLTAAQSEVGLPTPYIKTEASQVTRGVAISAANSVRGKLNIRSFSIYQEVTFNETGRDQGLMGYRSGSAAGFDTYINSSGAVLFRPAVGGSAQPVVNSTIGQIQAGVLAKILTWHDGDRFYIAVNGEVFQSSSGLSGMVDPLTTTAFQIGAYNSSVRVSNSNWRKLIVANTVPTTTEAIALTTLEDE